MKREHLKTYDQVQGYFDRRIETFLKSRGRRMVGWDEILDGGVTRTATVMSWRGEAGGIRAARRGNDVIMSPDGPLYFDAYQGDPNDEPEAIGNLSTPQMVYAYSPVPHVLTPAQGAHIIGVQGNIWTEYIATPDYLFYMLLPRMLALSEIGWTPEPRKNWTSFQQRSGAQYVWLAEHGYNFRIPNPEFSVDAPHLSFANVSSSIRTVQAYTDGSDATIAIGSAIPGSSIHYTLDGSAPSAKSRVYSAPLALSVGPHKTVDVQAVVVLSNGRVSTPSELILQQR
jgi:hexosaminidase